MLFICYSKCTTCKGVEKIMQEKGLKYDIRDIKTDNPSAAELKAWHEKSGLDIGKFYNTSGTIYRENNIKDKKKDMSLEEQYELLATNGMLVKRPILLVDDKVYVGTKVKEYVMSL